jgi:hypothetical protein
MLDDEVRHELMRLALSDARSGRAALAKAQAIRLLERISRDRDRGYPRDRITGRFRPSVDPQWWELDWRDSDEVREGWRAHLSR